VSDVKDVHTTVTIACAAGNELWSRVWNRRVRGTLIGIGAMSGFACRVT
jgi:hypothetical protein